ncbi:single-stranded-DNA-specific exonuclease RecJ [Aureibacter tunicatorum]|uniref:Single-stranded-DNA-specific exonuclease RecJ n=1 Tax=Aureibacter tunicatorum TaxID=866807 RepID=A0AAE4BQC7_9BACT|nr:single-stranded-DNA-specific exonuclease RecJ [Aureibacter tunicatorum]MDR6237401.1 single-stranded-DNA-specific exonuclease [Aureibacter tunicatorum]BDD06391.1 single-stranded-DNA-specific exonuclease RecJ [Aureibacter tunicatorum]
MVKRWIYKDFPEESDVIRLSSEINVNKTIASVLLQRGIQNFDHAKKYFRPSLDDLYDPFLMKDMDKAVERIAQAIKQREKILIYGDYDVDGTTSVALVYKFLKLYYPNCEYYIPDRYKEGYGVSQKGIETAKEKNIKLIISLDCGIKAIDRIATAKSYGIDFIVCDHHLPGEDLPQAVAVLDPKRKDCPYPFKELSGCGVGFKLMQGFARYMEYDDNELMNSLDLLAVSIASDIVPIVDENRILAHFGLQQLNKKPSPGLQALIDLGNKSRMTISSIVFGIGPRINAAGRIAHANAAVDLLLAEGEEEASFLANKVNENNTIRKNVDSNITAEAIKMIEENDPSFDKKATVLFKSDWHKGVVGIVASRCIDKYYRPTIILTESNRKATGSARSVHGFDIYEAISDCSEYLDQYGGHMYAAGLTLDIEKVDAFKEKFEKIVEERISDEQLIPQIEVDYMLDFDQINFKFFNILKQMAPFGPENMQPVFVSKDLKICERPRILKEEHIKFKVTQEGSSTVMEAIGFGFAQYFELINSGMRFRMAYTIEENNFKDNKSLQLYIKDIKFD